VTGPDLGDAEAARLDRAMVLLGAGRPDDALGLVREVVAVLPDNPTALGLLAVCLLEVGEGESGTAAARRAVALDPGDPGSLDVLAMVLSAGGESREARQVARTLVRLAPHGWRSHFALAVALGSGRIPRRREALASAEQALRLAPESPDALNLVGWCRLQLGRVDAREFFERALAVDPTNADALYYLGLVGLDRARLAEAGEMFRAGLRVAPHSVPLRRRLGEVALRAVSRLIAAVFLVAFLIGGFAAAYDLPYGGRVALGVGLVVVVVVQLRRTQHDLPLEPRLWLADARDRGDVLVLTTLTIGALLVAGLVALTFGPDPWIVPVWVATIGLCLVGAAVIAGYRIQRQRGRA
jgi:cytochrome c-type biogenesis protein CcmH/NrfG